MPDMPRLVLCGSPHLLAAAGRRRRLGRHALCLLTLAALAAPLTRAQAAAMLYPELPDAEARRNLRQLLFSQHALLDPLLEQQGDLLALRAGTLVDALAEPAAAELDAPYRPLLQGMNFDELPSFQQWLDEIRESARQARLDRLAAAASAHEAAGQLARALALAQRLVAESPASEHGHRRLMRLHYLRGDRAAALAAFDHCEQVLKDELSARPEAETLVLLHQIEGGEVARTSGPHPVPPTVFRPPRLIGRAAEWAALQAAWDDGACAIVLGEAGVGKTRLIGDFALAHGQAQGQVLVAGARLGDAQLPYALLGRLLRALFETHRPRLRPGVRAELARVLPELGGPAPGRDAGDPARFIQALDAALAAAARHGLQAVVLDDLHHADAATLDAVCHLAAGNALRWIVAGRADEFGAPARQLVETLLAAGPVARIALEPLGVAEVAELLDSLGIAGLGAAQADAIHRHTGGNPLFVLETLKAMLVQGEPATSADLAALGLPAAPSLRRMIEQRITRLSAGAIKLARCAAIAGQDFTAELASHVLHVHALDLADAWAELEAAHVLSDSGFAHDLIHEAARASVPEPIARQLHRDIATFLQAHAAEPARLALHWEQAQAWPEAGAAGLLAAESAAARARPAEQAALLAQAARCFGLAGDGERRFDALLRRVAAVSLGDLGAPALEALGDAQAVAATPDQQLRVQAVQAELLDERNDPSAVEIAESGLERARAAGRKDLETRFALTLAGAWCLVRRADEAVALLLPLRAWVDDHLEMAQRSQFAMALALGLDYANHLREALPVWDVAIEQARSARHATALGQALANKGSTLAKIGLVDQAALLCRQGLDLMLGEDGNPGAASRPMQTRCTLAHRLRDIGHYDEALALLEQAHAAFVSGGLTFWQQTCEHLLAQSWLQLGQPARAQRLLDGDVSGQPLGLQVMRAVHRAELAQRTGGDALAPIRHALALMQGREEDVYFRIATLFASAIVPAPEGEAMAAGLASWAHIHQRHGLALAGHVRAAGAALAQGAAARAVPQVRAALELAREYVPDSFYLPEMWLVAARVFDAAGQPAGAARAACDGQNWVLETARAHVPAAFRDSFLRRNPVNRELLALAARPGGAG